MFVVVVLVKLPCTFVSMCLCVSQPCSNLTFIIIKLSDSSSLANTRFMKTVFLFVGTVRVEYKDSPERDALHLSWWESCT